MKGKNVHMKRYFHCFKKDKIKSNKNTTKKKIHVP